MKLSEYDISKYRVEIIKEENCYVGVVHKLPGCVTQGDTPDEVMQNIQEAIELWILSAEENGERIPTPDYSDEDDYSGKVLLRMPKYLHKQLALEAKSQGCSLNMLLNNYLSNQLGVNSVNKAREKKKDLISRKVRVKDSLTAGSSIYSLAYGLYDFMPAGAQK